MKEMSVSLFEFIHAYIKFFANPEIQMETWVNYDAGNEDTCHDWIVNFQHSWRSIRNELNSDMLLNEIDNLYDKLTAYLTKIPQFREPKLRDLHRKILRDYDWYVIQEYSKMIFQQARKMLD
ncbi:MAG: hypothetical protein LW832_01145 [Parachlamydia sp.]|jgi:hypothetical protein|nr:hypothetical protein [Parachlamydia sp.]